MPGPSNQRAARELDPTATEHQRVLRAAEQVFADHGFHEARMKDISAAARVSLRSVYEVARGKEEIFLALHSVRARSLLARIERALGDETRSPADSLMALIDAVATFFMDHPHFLRIQLRDGGAWALYGGEDALFVHEARASDQMLERLFRRGIRAGVFYDEDPRTMVANLRALGQVQLAHWVVRRKRISKRGTIEAVQRAAKRLFCC